MARSISRSTYRGARPGARTSASAAERTVKALPGVKGAVVSLTAERKQGSAPPPPRPSAAAPAHSHGHARRRPARSARRRAFPASKRLSRSHPARAELGKSTTAVNLALALKANGLRVGILDADVYGPSMPRLLGITGRPQQSRTAHRSHGEFRHQGDVHGLPGRRGDRHDLRGPMVQSALMQMLREVAWGDLDVLVVDMPPGTGDAQLTMAQQCPSRARSSCPRRRIWP